MKLLLAACLLAIYVCVAIEAQTPALQSSGEEVVIDVVVRDKKGHAITDLAQSDFEVFDNGQKRAVQSFRFVSGQDRDISSPGSTPARLNPLRQVRLVTLIFDRLDMNGRLLSRQAALDLLNENIPANTYIGVYAIDSKLEALQPFTADRALLRKAVELATSGTYTELASESAALQQHIENLVGPNQTGRQSLDERVDEMPVGRDSNGQPDTFALADKFFAETMLQSLQFSQRSELSVDAGRSSVFGLLDVVRSQYRLPGRKTILYFSGGFALSQGMDAAFKTVISTANRFNVSVYAIDAHGLRTSTLNEKATAQLATAAAASRDNGGPKSIGDNHITTASALSADTAMDSGKYNTQDTLAILAESTGGFLIANTNDFRVPLHRVVEDIASHYEISYLPAIEKYDASFRKINVKVSRPEMRVQSRSGYYALPLSALKGNATVSAADMPLLVALNSTPFPQSFPFESAGLHFRSDGRNQTCEFLLEMPLKGLTLQEQPDSNRLAGGVAYLALVKNDSGEVVKKLQGELPVQMTPDQVFAFRQTNFTDMEYFDVPPGRYTLETAVLDRDSGRTSAKKSVVLVPRPNDELAMSSVALIRSWKAKSADASVDDPFVFGERTMTPIITPSIRKSASTSLPFYLVIYPDPHNSAKPELSIEFDREGKVKRVGAPALPSADADGRIQYVATAPIEELQPGNYAVRFRLKQGSELAQEAFSLLLEP